MFLGCPELAWRRKMASHFSYLTLRQSSTNPKNIDARFSKSLMRINVGASIATSYPMAKLADNKTAFCHSEPCVRNLKQRDVSRSLDMTQSKDCGLISILLL